MLEIVTGNMRTTLFEIDKWKLKWKLIRKYDGNCDEKCDENRSGN